jgi:hypothetical protein
VARVTATAATPTPKPGSNAPVSPPVPSPIDDVDRPVDVTPATVVGPPVAVVVPSPWLSLRSWSLRTGVAVAVGVAFEATLRTTPPSKPFPFERAAASAIRPPSMFP